MFFAAAVDCDEEGGREENNKVEKVDTETLNLIWVTQEPLVVDNWFLRFWNPQLEQKLLLDHKTVLT